MWRSTQGPIEWILALLVAQWTLPVLELPILYQNYLSRLLLVLALLVLIWLLMRLVNLGTERVQLQNTPPRPKRLLTMLMFGRRLMQALILLFGLLAIVRTLGANVDPALALIGLAGVAVALASQKSLENLFGGISILSDKALRVGDYCRVGDVEGTVESIGLRSTRIRTLAPDAGDLPERAGFRPARGELCPARQVPLQAFA